MGAVGSEKVPAGPGLGIIFLLKGYLFLAAFLAAFFLGAAFLATFFLGAAFFFAAFFAVAMFFEFKWLVKRITTLKV
ncbi:MAG TPA: hypothetical protein VGM41_11525 [Chitinophagaceae bacterium]